MDKANKKEVYTGSWFLKKPPCEYCSSSTRVRTSNAVHSLFVAYYFQCTTCNKEYKLERVGAYIVSYGSYDPKKLKGYDGSIFPKRAALPFRPSGMIEAIESGKPQGFMHFMSCPGSPSEFRKSSTKSCPVCFSLAMGFQFEFQGKEWFYSRCSDLTCNTAFASELIKSDILHRPRRRQAAISKFA